MDVHQIEALALVVLDGISILVPAARVPVEILHKVLDGIDESDVVPFSFPNLDGEKVAQVRATLAGMAAVRSSAATSAMARAAKGGPQEPPTSPVALTLPPDGVSKP